MRFALTLTVLLTLISSLAMGLLVWKFTSNKIIKKTQESSNSYNYSRNTAKINIKTDNQEKVQKQINTSPSTWEKDERSFLNDWEKDVPHPTSSQIAVMQMDTIKLNTDEQKINLNNILNRVSKQLQSIGKNVDNKDKIISDEDIDNLVYRTSSVDLGTTKEALHMTDNKELRAYGNALASKLTAFRIAQGNQLEILDNFIKHSNNKNAKEKVLTLSRAYTNLATKINTLKIPTEVSRINQDLVKALQEISEELQNFSKAKTNEKLYALSLRYNKKSENLAKQTLKLIDTFLFNDIHFKSYEPGSIFMFK